MPNFIPVRRSQVFYQIKTPLYIKKDNGEFILYKAENTRIDSGRFDQERCPQLYIPEHIKAAAYEELHNNLKNALQKRIEANDTRSVKAALNEIVNESFHEPLRDNLQILPETLDIIYQEYSYSTKLLRNISNFQYGGTTVVEHSVNAMLLVLNYCLFHGFREEDTKRYSLGALLHDVGLTKIPGPIVQANKKLTDSEFAIYKTHTALGYNIIKANMEAGAIIAEGALEHHERLDGSGFPKGISELSVEGRLIGIIDSFDQLTNSEKRHRKKVEPFGALKRIQHEILTEGKFDKEIFRNLCLSLVGKRRFD